MRLKVRRRWRRVRPAVVLSAVAIGVFASIATSYEGEISLRTQTFELSSRELSTQSVYLVRLCPTEARLEEAVEHSYSLRIDASDLGSAAVPVILSIDGSATRSERLVEAQQQAIFIHVDEPVDPTADRTACSPWARVAIGPAVDPSEQSELSWSLTISDRVEDVSDAESDAPRGELEIRRGP